MEEKDKKLYLVAVGKLLDRNYQFLTTEEIEEINKGLMYKDMTEAFTDKECEKNAIVITAVPIKNKPVEILLARKHKTVEHMELNVPIYIATVKNSESGAITRVLSDIETLPYLNNDYESVVGTEMLELPEGYTLYSVPMLISYIMATAKIDIVESEIRLDDEIFAEMHTGDTAYSLTQKLLKLL